MATQIHGQEYDTGTRRAFTQTFQNVVGTSPVEILPESFSRVGATIKNAGAVNCYVGSKQAILNGDAHIMTPGDNLNLISTTKVHIAAASGTCLVSSLAEYVR
jgi:hypothetical protein